MKDGVALISGTGPQGRGLAQRFALAGVAVALGSRRAERAEEVAASLRERVDAHCAAAGVAKRGKLITGFENGRLIGEARFVVLSVPYANAEETLLQHRAALREGQVFVDVTVPLDFSRGDVQLVPPSAGSASLQLRALLPREVPLLGAFKTLPAHVLEGFEPLGCDTFVYGDDRQAKQDFIALAGQIEGLRPLDVGGLSAALTVEGMTALIIRINRKRRSQSGRYRVVI